MKVLVTGSASRLARVLLPRLAADARITEVIGIDWRASGFRHPRFREVALDIRAPTLRDHLRGVDALIHMAFVVMHADLGARRHDRALIQDINVRGTQHVIETAAAAGIRQIIHLSSTAIYGTTAVPQALSESAARRPLAGFAYGEDKAKLEDWLDEFCATHTAWRVARLRPHAILGPHAQPYLRALLATPFYPRLPTPLPDTQCVHEDDVVQAIALCLHRRAHGAFNLACADAASFRSMHARLHRWALPLPATIARAALRYAWWRKEFGTEPSWFDGLYGSLVVDSSRARRELGWQPRYDSVASIIDSLRA